MIRLRWPLGRVDRVRQGVRKTFPNRYFVVSFKTKSYLTKVKDLPRNEKGKLTHPLSPGNFKFALVIDNLITDQLNCQMQLNYGRQFFGGFAAPEGMTKPTVFQINFLRDVSNRYTFVEPLAKVSHVIQRLDKT